MLLLRCCIRCPLSRRACAKAAEGGWLELLQWLREQGCKWDEETCHKAASKGHLQGLEYVRKNDCPWVRNHYNKGNSNSNSEQ